MAVLALRRVLELRNRGKTIFEQSLKDVKEKVTNDFSWIRDEAWQEMGGPDDEGQTDLARCIEDVAKGILRKSGLPTETEMLVSCPVIRWICSMPFGMKLQA